VTDPLFCSTCGRKLVEVVEPDGYDPDTGEPKTVTWYQCPRFPRNAVMALFRFGHTSVRADGWIDRSYT